MLSNLELSKCFRGCIDDQGRITKRYFPEIEIERVWIFSDDDLEVDYANNNFLSCTSVDPRNFSDKDAILDAIMRCIHEDLLGLLEDLNVENSPLSEPLLNSRTLAYRIWISNDNRNPDDQPRIKVTEINNPLQFLQKPTAKPFEILPEDQEELMILIGMCAPWFNKTKYPQLELFAA